MFWEVSVIPAITYGPEDALYTIKQIPKSHLPGPTAVYKALKISEQKVKDEAEAYINKLLRAKRLIIWGRFIRKDKTNQLITRSRSPKLSFGFHQRLRA